MKKNITLCLLLCLFVLSCKKDHSKITVTDPKTYKINFNVSGFSQQILNSGKKQEVNASSQSMSVAGNVQVIFYDVFDTNNNIVRTIKQSSGNSNFGTISDNLPAGTYTIVIVAGQNGLDQNYSDNSLRYPIPGYKCFYPLIPDNNNYGNYGYFQWGDTFYKKITLTVAGGDITQNINLDRVVSQLQVNIEDAIPAGAKYISLVYGTEYLYFDLVESKPYLNLDGKVTPGNTITTTVTLPDSVKGKTNFKFSHIVANTISPISVSINCYDASSKLIAQAVVNNVTMQVNKRTILSGELFGIQNNFNVKIDPVWDPSINVVHF